MATVPQLKKGESYVDRSLSGAPLPKSYKHLPSGSSPQVVKPAVSPIERHKRQSDDDASDGDDDAGDDWVDAVQTTEQADQLFGLFAALGNAGGRGSNAMNRNPLPRGRAIETADWITDLFKFLPPSTGSCGVPNVRVPLTLTLRHSRPHTWYFSPKRGGVVEQPASTDSEEIIARFLNAAIVEAAVLDLDGQVDIVCMYMSTVRFTKDGIPKTRTRTEYFDEELLRDFLVHRATKRDGLLQLFVIPTGSKSSMVRARFVSSRLVTVETTTNVNFITDSGKTVIERGATFDGEEHLTRTNPVPATSAMFNHINKLMREVLTHVKEHIPETYLIGEATAYFRVHADSKLWFLYMPIVSLLHHHNKAPCGGSEAVPLSPRVAKPVLAYSGSLPKDYFRCPCCGSVVNARDREQVPYRMVLQHLELLDAADGTMDGDSPALRAIASTLDKVSRNPQYYAELYKAAAKSNPTTNISSLLLNCGYPGGDLELDDKLESPAELICFRLLQLAVAGTLAGSSRPASEQQLSIAHYKWVRDNKASILQKARVFVCSECSLDFSQSLASTHSHSAAAKLTADASMFEMSQAEALSMKDPIRYAEKKREEELKRQLAFLATLNKPKEKTSGAKAALSLFGAKPAPAPAPAPPPPPAADEEEALPPDNRSEAELRKALSLPLLRPKLDRAKLAKQRPWRILPSDGEAIDERKPRDISEEPKFKAVAALKGVDPKPDPRYLPSLQQKEERKEILKRRMIAREAGITIREANAAQVSQAMERRAERSPRRVDEGGWETDQLDDGGGTFMTNSLSAPTLRTRQSKVGRRQTGRLPMLDASAEGGSVPDIVARQHAALNDAAADHGALNAQLASLNNRMAHLEGKMGPIKKNAVKREAKQLSFAQSEKLNASLVDIRAQLIKQLPRVVDLFRSFDRNGDGKISRSEFVQVLPMLGLPQYGASEMDAMYDILDTDRSGAVDFRELHKLLRKGHDMQLASWMQVGAKGEIEVEARNKYRVRASAREGTLQASLKDASIEDMRSAMTRQASRVTDFYKHLDVNGDGSVTRAEFRAALPLLGFGAGGIPAIDALYDQLDVNKNGTVEYAELQAALRRDDIELAAALQDGAVKFDTEAKNAFDLRRSDGGTM